jgi:hypothetical protein
MNKAKMKRPESRRLDQIPTLRDYFAAKAMQGILIAASTNPGCWTGDEKARAAYAYMVADAMLEERGKG